MTTLRDAIFEAAFRRLFVYNILFEDAEVDEAMLGLDERSRVLAITGAGCGVAGMLASHPRSIDAVDINPHHLALTALKCGAARHVRDHTAFYDLCGRGWHADPSAILGTFADRMPSWARRYWRVHRSRFQRGLYREGLTASMLRAFRKATGLDGSWLAWASTLDADARVRAVDEWIAPTLRSPAARAFLRSPAQLVALGINFSQRDRILVTESSPDLAEFVVEHLRRLARTDVATNWFVWYAIAGHFDHARADAVPSYLRADRHARSTTSPTDVRFLRQSILEVLERAPRKTYTHYTLCDAPDWMDAGTQRALLQQILRTAQDGAIVLHRSVETEPMVERLGMGDRIVQLADRSARATELDRTRMYRAVRFYRVER